MENWNDYVISTQDAIIEDIYIDNGTGFVTISYGVMDENDMLHISLVTLIVTEDTLILDQFGQNLSFWDLQMGMVVDADFSAMMTRSIPPQSRAFRIIVVAPNHEFIVRVDRVVSVDLDNNFLYTGVPDDIMTQMRFVITDATEITDQNGNRIGLGDLQPGQNVRVEHAIFQTLSIPPQTTAFRVDVL